MTAILAITATPHALRAVVRDPAVRLRIQVHYRGQPGARLLIDGRPVITCDPPRDASEALRLVATFVRTPGITVTAVAAVVKLEDGIAFGPAFAIIDAARIAWPGVPHVACLCTEPDVEAMMDDRVRALLRGSDDRAERILDYPRGHFARARARVRAELKEEITRNMHRVPWAAS
jgi:hypothetical protein